ncbi:MAG: lipopolysaccharide biosynthesis protein [Cellulomonadaceae bacterium]
MSSALTQGARGGGVMLIGQGGKLLIQFASIILLSRLLAPEDFGLIAMVTSFVAFGELIRDFGTSVVGLQRQHLSQQQASNLFWLSVALGLGSALLLLAITPLVVLLYAEPRVGVIMPSLAVTVLLNAAGAQFQVQLARSMRFRRFVAADLTAQGAGLMLAIAGALNGWDYWALVAQVVTVALVGFLSRLLAASWLPSRPRRHGDNRAMFGDSFAFGFAQLLTYVSSNIDTVTIGARWDAASLGGYTRALQLLTAPLNSIIGPLTQVVLPTVNRAREEGRTTDSVLLRLQFALGLPIVWIYAMTAAVAGWLVPFLLGPEWDEAVPIFQILATGGAVWTFSRISYWGFIAANLGRDLLRYNLVTKSLASLLIFGASFISIEAIAWAVSVGLIVSWPINLIWLACTAGQASWRYWWNGVLLVVAAFLGFTAAWGVTQILVSLPPWSASILGIVAGTTVYLAAVAVVPSGRRGLESILRALRKAFCDR